MRACILAIGDEIVGGLTVDTNTAWIAERLRAEGVEVAGSFAVPDDEAPILRALERASSDAELVVTTGGLGPTADDLTSATVARFAGRMLELHPPSLRLIEERFRERGMEMPPNNRKQACLPAGSTLLPNSLGTAPGFVCPAEQAGRTVHIACFPGVPHEMRRMFDEGLMPWIAARRPETRFAWRVFSTVGLAESRLDELLSGVARPDEARLAFRAAFPRIQARLTVTGAPGEDLEARLDALERRVRDRLGDHLYAVGDEGMEETLGRLLRERRRTLAVAESCTGGLIGHRITEVPGSSEYFLLGVVAYSNAAKQRLLGVREATLAAHGAVSVETAVELARGIREAAGSDLGLSTTGVAGPGGGMAEKPVGTVCVGLAWEGGVWSRRYELGSRSRGWIKGMTAQLALDAARRCLLGTLAPEAQGVPSDGGRSAPAGTRSPAG